MIKYIFALTLLLSGSVCADQIQGLVIRVLDGDTLEILQARHPVRIRLVNIDAPEKKQPFGRWSMNQLKNLVNRPGFPGECFICELRLPDHRFRWKHNKLFLLLPEEYGPAFPAIVDCYTSPPT